LNDGAAERQDIYDLNVLNPEEWKCGIVEDKNAEKDINSISVSNQGLANVHQMQKLTRNHYQASLTLTKMTRLQQNTSLIVKKNRHSEALQN